MSIKSTAAKILAAIRVKRLNAQSRNAVQVQEKTLLHLLKTARNTRFGETHNFQRIKNSGDFKKQVPVRNYEALKPWIEKIVAGQPDILWPGKPAYLSKTSGTTSGTKYIPNTKELLKSQIAGARDALLFYIHNTGNADFLNGSMMFLSGSPELETSNSGIKVGRLSGIVNHFIPAYLKRNQVPSWKTNCIENWEEKIEAIVSETLHKDLRLISGIPPWVQMYFDSAQKRSEKNIPEIWPNLSVFVYGGVDFKPYAPIFSQKLGKTTDLVETYPASEGFIAIQDNQDGQGMRLMTDYGIYYEFIPMSEYGKPHAPRLNLSEVQMDVQYALILSNNAGLWAYDIGDTVRFTCLNPFRIKVTGRTAQYISAFGEHVIVEEIHTALETACKETGAQVTEFTVMPYIRENESRHEWFVEFLVMPQHPDIFRNILESSLCRQNTYYRDLIQGKVLSPLKVYSLKSGASHAYMKSIGKLGGQNKFPRVKNEDGMRKFLDVWTM